MKPLPFALILVAILLFACNRHPKNSKQNTAGANSQKKRQKRLKPVFGYRFIITGDFDGDGKKDTLIEHFMGRTNHQEIDKFHYSLVDTGWIKDTLADSNGIRKPISIIICNNAVTPLSIDETGKSLGLLYLKNEGDLDGDGGDELSYVDDPADASSINFCSVMSYKIHQWKRIYGFQIREWQIPDLPQVNDKFPFKAMYKEIADSTNQRLEKELNAFKGFITRIGSNKIKVMTFTDTGDDTTKVVSFKLDKKKG